MTTVCIQHKTIKPAWIINEKVTKNCILLYNTESSEKLHKTEILTLMVIPARISHECHAPSNTTE